MPICYLMGQLAAVLALPHCNSIALLAPLAAARRRRCYWPETWHAARPTSRAHAFRAHVSRSRSARERENVAHGLPSGLRSFTTSAHVLSSWKVIPTPCVFCRLRQNWIGDEEYRWWFLSSHRVWWLPDLPLLISQHSKRFGNCMWSSVFSAVTQPSASGHANRRDSDCQPRSSRTRWSGLGELGFNLELRLSRGFRFRVSPNPSPRESSRAQDLPPDSEFHNPATETETRT